MVPIEVTDGDLPPNELSFALPEAPAGAVLDSGRHELRWTPIASDLGAHEVQVTVTDSGTPPLSASRAFTITVARDLRVSAELVGGEIVIRFTTLADRHYRVETAPDMPAERWQVLVDGIAGNGGVRTVTDPISSGTARRYYRIVEVP